MSLITSVEERISKTLQNACLPVLSVKLMINSNPEYGEYQINEAFKIAKEMGKSPLEIAEKIKEKLTILPYFKDINVTKPGFVNLSFKYETLMDYFNELNFDITKHVDSLKEKTIFLDYGGPNASKALHVGHMRSANIGEALKRLLRSLGITVISDIHIGDNGLPAGMVLSEIHRLEPDSPFFKISDSYPDVINYNVEDLKTIYPEASKRAKEDDRVMGQAKLYSKMLQEGHPGLKKLWHLYMQLSIEEIKKVYEDLNISFDLWESETDSFEYFKVMDQVLADKKLVEISDGAWIIDVRQPHDKKELPPFMLYKSDGAALYSTTDLATIVGRVKRFLIDEMWYLTDKRQALHFTQLFRASNKAGLTSNIKLVHIGFGTMNGPDGKPFKTRDGGVLSLTELVSDVKSKTNEKLSDKIPPADKTSVNHKIAVSVIKYADLLPIITTDYIFDVEKFIDTEGKTGPYLLYSTVRIKSLLKKAGEVDNLNITKLSGDSDYNVLLTLAGMPVILTNAYHNQSLNEVCEYLYKLNSAFNKFYAEHNIINQTDDSLKQSWLAIAKLVLITNEFLLNILAIEIPEQM